MGIQFSLRGQEEWGADGETSTAPDNYMIVAVSVDVQEVARQGSAFQWPTDCMCPRCGHKTWGHGKVARIFDGIADLVLIPRRRCSGCRSFGKAVLLDQNVNAKIGRDWRQHHPKVSSEAVLNSPSITGGQLF
jgi:hypothetical protein